LTKSHSHKIHKSKIVIYQFNSFVHSIIFRGKQRDYKKNLSLNFPFASALTLCAERTR